MTRRPGDMSGAKTLAEWIEVYERRAGDDVRFRLEEGEHVYYHPEHGFFTWRLCENHPWISIPKMCGDGRFLRELVCDLLEAAKAYGVEAALCCSRRRPAVWLKVHGGCLHHVEYTRNLNSGNIEPLYFYLMKSEGYRRRSK